MKLAGRGIGEYTSIPLTDDYDQPLPPTSLAGSPGDRADYGEQHDWEAPEDDSRARTFFFKFLPLLGLCFFAFWPAWNGEFLWQDDIQVKNNNSLRSPEGLGLIWTAPTATPQWAPMAYTFLWPQYQIWQDRAPLGYHLVNVLLHATSALLIWMLLRRLEVRGAFLSACIFALHPLQVEPVAWIARQPMLFGAFWGLCFVIVYLRYSGADATRTDPSKIWRLPETPKLVYTFAVISYLFAVLSAPVLVCTLPFVMFAIGWWKLEGLTRQDITRALPLVLIGLGGVVTNAIVEFRRYEPASGLSPLQWVLVAPRAIGFYVLKFFWPTDLSAIYAKWSISPADPMLWIAAGLIACAALYVVLRREVIGRAGIATLVTYLLLLLPMVTPINRVELRTAYVADRFQYLALAVLAAAVIGLAAELLATLGRRARWIGITSSAVVVTALFVIVLTSHASHFATTKELWANTVDRDRGNVVAMLRLGQAFEAEGDIGKAIDQYQSVLRLTRDQDADALLALGQIYEKQQTTDPQKYYASLAEAQRYYQRAMEVAPDRPEPYRSMGLIFAMQRRYDQAFAMYEQGLQRFPNDEQTLRLLAVGQAQSGQLEKSILNFKRALDKNPYYVQAHIDLANAYFLTAQSINTSAGQVIEPLRRTSDLTMAYVRGHLEICYGSIAKMYLEEAFKSVNTAYGLDPKNYELAMSLGNMHVKLGMFERSYEFFRAGTYLRDKEMQPWFMAGAVQVAISRNHWYRGQIGLATKAINDAIVCLQQAQKINPNAEQVKKVMEQAIDLQRQQRTGSPPRITTQPALPIPVPK